ncbi:kelch repeat-containing protein [Sodiomyces alkalinus F11]|uniref:Kelch repeat-containing protein n=1 Tax=Sodiomyces alkalinus (strain CBS 110278 / VKM F-3762 / F11) TaxID=1314773 RepID=A0A3N2PLU4_SODAK|nr:kelch repeat-containing protein [Sodiomyces alkalinus F11]ROT35326.1 kelch repeat-containing protein [Sodiomyces alkalinus F11]
MAFLFKSKKNQDRALASRDGNSGSQGSIQSASARVAKEEKTAQHRATPTGSLSSFGDDANHGSPDQPYGRQRGPSVDQAPSAPSDLPFRNGVAQQPPSNPNAALYPWSQRRLNYTSSHPSPFPRYGAAVNSISSKEGDIYVMGGLINSATVKGDLWMIEAGQNMTCYPLPTTAEGPGPRVGHAGLLVGNAFIVYGGDTKVEDSDLLDETLYLLNTSTRQWSRALPPGPRPSGRYGHTLNILGSKIFIFGGQVEGYFMNDLAAFDLNKLQLPNNRWEMLIENTESTDRVPPARTNHSVITFNEKMYLFGGTNGFQWFNDVWCYDPIPNEWTQLDCIGYIPVPREGHTAALVDDVMYVFGGRTEEGADLGDLAAFRITSRRWYTFQNMGPSPSPRSGHSMTTVGKQIVVVGGEPSTAPISAGDLGIIYVLDTTKIRYPNDSQAQQNSRGLPQPRRPSTATEQNPVRTALSRDGSQDSRGPTTGGPRDAGRVNSPPNGYRGDPIGSDINAVSIAGAQSRLPRTSASSPAGPPPQGPTPAKPQTSSGGRIRGASTERDILGGGSIQVNSMQSPTIRAAPNEDESPIINGHRTPPQQQGAPKPEANPAEQPKTRSRQAGRSQESVDSTTESSMRSIQQHRPASPPTTARQPSNLLSRRSSGRNSQTVALLKELDSARNRNAWYASELELARKAGYAPNASLSPLEGRATETFDDEDKPLIEALLAMRTELANVQSAVDKQAILAAKQIAEAEKQRDAAIQEAIYAKAKLAAQVGGGSAASTPQQDFGDRDNADDRSVEISKKLATALHHQKMLESQLETTRMELEAERRARQLADDTANASQKRMTELESYKTTTSPELERLKAELHMVQREAREQSVLHAEAMGAMELLRVEKDEWQAKYEESVGNSQERDQTFDSLKEAVGASAEMKMLLEDKLDEERAQREKVEDKLSKLKAEHEARTAELVATTRRLRDAEEMAEKHANEARTHRQAVLAGFDKLSARNVGGPSKAESERLEALQKQLETANDLVKKYQQEADVAADKLRTAEERIAGLEVYQEQSSREGVAIRRQLQAALRDTQSLQGANADLKNQLQNQQLETNAVVVQHNTLKDILAERGISPTNMSRNRSVSSPRTASPEQARIRELEEQLEKAAAAQEEAEQRNMAQLEATEAAYRDKLTQLENDYQSAVHYVKGTEKMLKQLKEQLARYKAENAELRSEMDELEEQRGQSAAALDWEKEREVLQRRVDSLQEEIRASGAQLEERLRAVQEELEEVRRERDTALKTTEEVAETLSSSRRDLEQLQQANSLLEQRAQDAEQKVSMLLDQVESSVDNYRRRSRQVPSVSSELTAPGGGAGAGAGSANGVGLGRGHNRQESSDVESAYGGGGGTDPTEARNSAALDNLATELETLRTHWEATNKNYRLSNTFDFDIAATPTRRDGENGPGLSESLADWRKRLEVEEQTGDGGDASQSKAKGRVERP